MGTIKVVAGLGNPGARYDKTRHNIGFALVDEIARNAKSEWREKGDALISEVVLEEIPLLLVKPQSFMNLSGEPLSEIVRYRSCAPEEVAVVHDEIDLELGKLRVKIGGGDGGHNGIRSVRELFGTPEFVRVRLGVGRPLGAQAAADDHVSQWVLGKFTKEESAVVKELIERGTQALVAIAKSGVKIAQNRFNG